MAGRSNIYYVEDHTSFGEFMVSAQIREPVGDVADDIASEARGRSHRGGGAGPHMADQWRVNRLAGVRILLVDGGHVNPRVRVDVLNPDIAAAAEEFGIQPGNKRRNTLREIAARYGNFVTNAED